MWGFCVETTSSTSSTVRESGRCHPLLTKITRRDNLWQEITKYGREGSEKLFLRHRRKKMLPTSAVRTTVNYIWNACDYRNIVGQGIDERWKPARDSEIIWSMITWTTCSNSINGTSKKPILLQLFHDIVGHNTMPMVFPWRSLAPRDRRRNWSHFGYSRPELVYFFYKIYIFACLTL